MERGIPFTVRFRLQPFQETFDDLVYGPVSHDVAQFEGKKRQAAGLINKTILVTVFMKLFFWLYLNKECLFIRPKSDN
jgi:hypothetical protein